MTSLQPYYESEGSGPDLVLLHGWGLHSGIFDLLKPLLTPHFTVHSIDLPGFGRSALAKGHYDLDFLAQQVLTVAPSRAHYLGWSLGGMVATKIALLAPTRVNRLITVASNPRFVQDDTWPHAMKASVLESFTHYLRDDYEGTVIRFLGITTMGSETQKDDIKQLKETVFLHGMPAPEALRGGLAILQNADLRADLATLTLPFLRIYGRLDALVPVHVADDVQTLCPHSEHVVFRKASHSPFMSHRDEFAEKIMTWLKIK